MWWKNRDLEQRMDELEFRYVNDRSLHSKVGIFAHLPKTFYPWRYCCHDIEVNRLLSNMIDDGIDIEKYHIHKYKKGNA